jgi:hypothetical protein
MRGVRGWVAGVAAPRGVPVPKFPALEMLGGFHSLRAAVAG